MSVSVASEIVLDDHGVTIDDVVAVARGNARVVISANARVGIAATRAHVEELAAGAEPKYGTVSYTHLTLPTNREV